MVFNYKAGSFQKSNSIATPVVQTISGLGFTPKAILLYTGASGSDGSGTIFDGLVSCIGFANLTVAAGSANSNAAVTTYSDDNVGTSNALRRQTDNKAICVINNIGSVLYEGSVAAITDGFEITWTTNATTSDWISYIAVGGDDVQGVSLGQLTIPSVTGNQDITGLTFQPDIVFLLSNNLPDINTTSTNAAQVIFGAGRSSGEQFVYNFAAVDNSATANNSNTQRTDRIYHSVSASSPTTLFAEAQYITSLSNGFRLNWVSFAPNATLGNQKVFYLAIKGGNWKIGAFNQPAAIGNQTISGLGHQPAGVMFLSHGRAAGTVINRDVKLSLGAASGSTSSQQGVIALAETHASDPVQNARSALVDPAAVGGTKVIRNITPLATAANSTVESAASYVGSTSDGFTVGWSTINSTTARQIIFVSAAATRATTTIARTWRSRYHNFNTIRRTWRSRYHNGGHIQPSAVYTHSFHIKGTIRRTWRSRYQIRNEIRRTWRSRYTLAIARGEIRRTWRSRYHNFNAIRRTWRTRYSNAPAAIFRVGHGKPFGGKISIIRHDWAKIFYTYDTFTPDKNPIHIEKCLINLAEESVGTFQIQIEDHEAKIDTSEVGKGNIVLIQLAKHESAFDDKAHDVLLGYVRRMHYKRDDTGVLRYVLDGFGAAIRFTERISTFEFQARRTSPTDPNPDKRDSSMFAYNLVRRLVRGTDHLPLGEPALGFTVNGVINAEPRVADFIPEIKESFVEFSAVMNRICETVGAIWGVNARGDVYLHYPSVEHSGILIKAGPVDEKNDDKSKTAYVIGGYNFVETIAKEDGFSNRLFGRSGQRNVTTTIANIGAVRDKYTALFSNTTPAEQEQTGPPIGEGGDDLYQNPASATAGIILIPHWHGRLEKEQIADDYQTRLNGYRELANLQRQYPTVKIIDVFMYPMAGPGADPGTVITDDDIPNAQTKTKIETVQEGGVTALGQIEVPITKSESQVKAEMARWKEWYGVNGFYFDDVGDITNVTYRNLLDSLATYAKNILGMKLMVLDFVSYPDYITHSELQTWHINTPFDIIDASQNGGSLNFNIGDAYAYVEARPHAKQTPPKKRFHQRYNIQTSQFPVDTIRQFMIDSIESGAGSYFHISDQVSFADTNDELPSYMGLMLQTIREVQTDEGNEPGEPLDIPNPRDLCQSITPRNPKFEDVILILSKIGNPQFRAGESHGTSTAFVPNALHGHIESSKPTSYISIDPDTGQLVQVNTEMPSGEIVGDFHIPFDNIGVDPTPIFLGRVVKRKRAIIPDRKYWIVLYGRGQSEEHTIRWHHADTPVTGSLSGQRIPGGHDTTQEWTVYNQDQSPGFAVSFFDSTLTFIESEDADSRNQFGLTESTVDLSFIKDPQLASRYLNQLLIQASRPKRIFEFPKVTAPDELILPGKMISFQDPLALHSYGGSDIIEAEVTEVHYNFDAYSENALGVRYISLRAVAYVDFAYYAWLKKLRAGEIAIPVGGDVIITPPLEPEPCPAGHHRDPNTGQCIPDDVTNPPPPTPTCPAGHHWDASLGQCVPDAPTEPTPPPAPPDLDRTGITRVRGPFTTYQDFLTAVNNAQPGDEIVLKNGSYSIPSSADAAFTRSGTTTNPIIVRAENVGGVTLSGGAQYDFNNCDNFTWYGFIHRHSGQIRIRNGCDRFRFSRCDLDLAEGSSRIHWIYLTDSTRVRIDHCVFNGMTTEGGYITTAFDNNIAIGEESIIEYNHFKNKSSPNDDSGEALINGASSICRNNFRTIVRYNLFENCNGDPEVITNKSCRNLYYNNTFRNCSANLVLRHGDNNAVIGNSFEGGVGIRVLGADQLVANNHVTSHNGGSSTGRRPLVVENGDANRPTSQGANYERVDNCKIIFNTFENGSGTSPEVVLWGRESRSLKPTNTLFRGNIIKAASGQLFNFDNSATASTNTFSDNVGWITNNASYGDLTTGMATRKDPGLAQGTDGIYRIAGTGSGAYGHVSTSTNPLSNFTTLDIDGETRTGRADAGCDQFSAAATKPKKKITVQDVGPAATTYLGDSPAWTGMPT